MVYYFTSSTVIPKAFIYVGKDKVESASVQILRLEILKLTAFSDEELIKYGLEEDVW